MTPTSGALLVALLAAVVAVRVSAFQPLPRARWKQLRTASQQVGPVVPIRDHRPVTAPRTHRLALAVMLLLADSVIAPEDRWFPRGQARASGPSVSLSV